MFRLAAFLAIFSAAIFSASGAELRVPEQFSAIQPAIEAAQPGDTILVGPGVYYENLSVSKPVHVISAEGAERTVIDAQYRYPVVRFSLLAGVTNSSVQGFTLRHGAGGILIQNASPLILGCNIVSNRGNGAIELSGGSPLIVSNVISRNDSSAFNLTGAQNTRVLHNVISENAGGSYSGAFRINGGMDMEIGHNVIVRNTSREPAISMVNRSDIHIFNNLIALNTGGGIRWLTPSDNRGPRVVYNTIAANPGGPAISAEGYDRDAHIENNIIQGGLHTEGAYDFAIPLTRNNLTDAFSGAFPNLNGINGNIQGDARFISRETGDFRLAFISPAIDRGTADSAAAADLAGRLRTVDGNRDGSGAPDLGAYEFAAAPPGPPAAVSLISTADGIFLSWPRSNDAAEYRIGRALAETGPYTNFALLTTNSFADSGLERDRRYYYRVASLNPFGEGEPSNPASERAGNLPPIAARDEISMLEDSTAEIRPLQNDSDPNGDAFKLVSITRRIPEWPDEDLPVLDSAYTAFIPPPDFTGLVSLIYVVGDDRGKLSTGVVTIAVTEVNDAPAAVSRTVTAEVGTAIEILLLGADPERGAIRYELIDGPEHGRIDVFSRENGRVIYRAGRSLAATDQFRFRVHDPATNSGPATITIDRLRPSDLDRDGMPDAWERERDINNPDTDPDRDGVINLYEYLANTDPRDPLSALKIVSAERSGGRIKIRWHAVGLQRYRVQHAPSLGAAFTDIVRPAEQEVFPGDEGAPGVAEFSGPAAGFYRIYSLP